MNDVKYNDAKIDLLNFRHRNLDPEPIHHYLKYHKLNHRHSKLRCQLTMSQPSTSSTLVPTSNDASSIEFEEMLSQSGAFSLFFREPTHEADRIELLGKKLMEQA